MNRIASTFLAIAMLSCVTIAGEFNSVLSVGDTAPSWDALPTTGGETLAMDQLSESDVIVLAFICNSCPYAIDVEDRLIKLHRDYNERRVTVVAVNVNTIEADAMPAMIEKAKQKAFPFVYLYDASQRIAKDYGAKYTPQFFVVNKDRKVIYMGAMDDSPDGKEVTKPYVRNAIDAALAGESVTVSETVPIGCRIRVKRLRRKAR
ncbi:thiol-disulfide oxidoreductase [Rubripirellula obstinata]|uniref:Thiol-disulfide oxidoreductase n=1 Tax=Rubripirellula obstinata TaxID=406547 RepID=A0A5B1CBM1_9BACT|nr:thioredoxin family protein [Rubripirellula obstinata]KAA1258507.1 thiol-disulfide oxidoreductase [Rubripirellula obstinata]